MPGKLVILRQVFGHMGHLSNLATDSAVKEVILHKNLTYERSEGNDICASVCCFAHVTRQISSYKRQQTANSEPTDIGVMVLLQFHHEGESHVHTPVGWL